MSKDMMPAVNIIQIMLHMLKDTYTDTEIKKMLTTSKVKVFLEIIMEHKKGLNKQAKACNQVSIND